MIEFSEQVSSKTDIVTRYFLRQLALAHYKTPQRALFVQYKNSLVETVITFVLLPLIGLVGLISIAGMSWSGPILSKRFGSGYALLPVLILGSWLGYRSLNKKLSTYRDDASVWTQYNSEKDRTTIGWQRLITFVICMGVMPFLGIFIWSLTRN